MIRSTGHSATSQRVLLLCFIIIMIDGYDSLMSSFIAPMIGKEFALGLPQIGRIFALGYTGAIVGAVCAGSLADRFGRKSVLYAFLAIAGIATLLSAAAVSFDMLLFTRFVAGLGLGGAVPSLVSLTAEHAPAARRSAVVTRMYIGYPVGAVVGGLITAAFLRFGWRDIFLGGGIAALSMLLVAYLIPETLVANRAEAPAFAGVRSESASSFIEQFREGRLAAALMLWIGLFCMLLLTYLLLSWTPTMVIKSGLTPALAALSGVILNLGGVVGALAVGPLVNRYGPFLPAVAMIGASTIMLVLLGRSFGSIAPLMTMLFLVGFTAIGGQLISPAMGVDLFPAHVRGAGTGSVLAIGRLGSIVGPIIGGALLAENFTLPLLFAVVAIPAGTAAIAFAIAFRVAPAVSAAARAAS